MKLNDSNKSYWNLTKTYLHSTSITHILMSTRSGTENKLNPQILWIYNRKENGFWKQKGINFALLEVSIHNFFFLKTKPTCWNKRNSSDIFTQDTTNPRTEASKYTICYHCIADHVDSKWTRHKRLKYKKKKSVLNSTLMVNFFYYLTDLFTLIEKNQL